MDDWYQFLPSVTHKVLDADQAEERFQQRNKVLNQFALKASIQQQLKDQDEEGGVTMKASSLVGPLQVATFSSRTKLVVQKIKDEMSSDEDEDTRDDEGGEEKRKQKKAKKGQDDAERKRKEKKQRVESADQVAGSLCST